MKALIDTNVIIDTLVSRKPFNESSDYVFLHSAMKTCTMYISATQITDIHYIVKKSIHNRTEMLKIMNSIIQLFKPLDVLDEDVICALGSPMTAYEDAILENIAYRNSCDYIITRNIKDYSKSRVVAIHPSDFVRLIES